MKTRSRILAVAAAALATVFISTTALADTLTVTMSGSPSINWITSTATGQQSSTLSNGGKYDGTYTTRFSLLGNCMAGPTMVLTFPANGTTPLSTLTLLMGGSLCGSNQSGFTVRGATGFFSGALNSTGTVALDHGAIVFDDRTGFVPTPAGPTPELDSLLLFASGALGLGGYGLMRMRARRQTPSS